MKPKNPLASLHHQLQISILVIDPNLLLCPYHTNFPKKLQAINRWFSVSTSWWIDTKNLSMNWIREMFGTSAHLGCLVFPRFPIYMGVSKNNGTPKWMVKTMENPINPWMIWGENPLFSESSKSNTNLIQTFWEWNMFKPSWGFGCHAAE